MNVVSCAVYAQQLYDNHAGLGTDKAVSSAIMLAINNLLGAATNVPTGSDLTATVVDHKADSASVRRDVASLYAKQSAGSISLTVVGESHGDPDDTNRANALIGDMTSGAIVPTLVVFERGMSYTPPTVAAPVVIESGMTTVGGGDFGMGLSRKQRSMVVAGYLVLVLAGGNQAAIDKVALLYGANHYDIADTHFDYFSRHTNAAYLLKRARTFFLVRSYVK